ncbi:galactose-specific lectin nattectin-like [Salarias fasciatus]|uniref:galactose-specific lectin nattectin-like n=1 Tax=Salarias fasciatus TaxID=181472 RepID=UPI00117666BE|nr:galactose-specific lectin nattectin-like [Salarias fasciatus]
MIIFFLLALGAASPSPDHEVQLQRGNCPMFWYSFQDRCYKYVASYMTWADAELHCVAQGANLVSVHSLEEHSFINSLIHNFDPVRKHTWNGLSDIAKEGAWMWSDGSQVNFLLWNEGEPNNGGGAGFVEHCGHTNAGIDFMWNDAGCGHELPFVCASRNICP